MLREEVEMCPHCMGENIIQWDVEKDGYEVKCQHCGEKIMLCDACLHSEDNKRRKCNWCEETGCWRKKKNLEFKTHNECVKYLLDNFYSYDFMQRHTRKELVYILHIIESHALKQSPYAFRSMCKKRMCQHIDFYLRIHCGRKKAVK